MAQLKDESREGLIPFLTQFREPVNPPNKNYWYDESKGLNLTMHDGLIKPIMLIPDSLGMLKTIQKDGGED